MTDRSITITLLLVLAGALGALLVASVFQFFSWAILWLILRHMLIAAFVGVVAGLVDERLRRHPQSRRAKWMRRMLIGAALVLVGVALFRLSDPLVQLSVFEQTLRDFFSFCTVFATIDLGRALMRRGQRVDPRTTDW